MIGIGDVLARIDLSAINGTPFSLEHVKSDGSINVIEKAQKGFKPQKQSPGDKKSKSMYRIKGKGVVNIALLDEQNRAIGWRTIIINTIIKFNNEYVNF